MNTAKPSTFKKLMYYYFSFSVGPLTLYWVTLIMEMLIAIAIGMIFFWAEKLIMPIFSILFYLPFILEGIAYYLFTSKFLYRITGPLNIFLLFAFLVPTTIIKLSILDYLSLTNPFVDYEPPYNSPFYFRKFLIEISILVGTTASWFMYWLKKRNLEN